MTARKAVGSNEQRSLRQTPRSAFADVGRAAIRTILYGVLVAGALTMLIPMLWMVSTSLKPPGGIGTIPPKLWPNPVDFRNYVSVFEQYPYGTFFLNSIKISALSTLGMSLSCAIGGFTFARLRFRGKNALFLALVSTIMVPGAVTLVPRFVLMKEIGWVDTHYALIVPSWTGAAFGVFLMRQYYLTIPQDLVVFSPKRDDVVSCSYVR